MAIGVLLRLSDWFMRPDLAKQATTALRAFDDSLNRAPHAYPTMLLGLLGAQDGLCEVVIASNGTKDLLTTALRGAYLPLGIRIVATDKQLSKLGKSIPLLKAKSTNDGTSVGFVCRSGTCKAPTTSTEGLTRSIAAALRQTLQEPVKK